MKYTAPPGLRLVFCLLLFATLGHSAAAAQPAFRSADALGRYIDRVLDADALYAAHWGVRVVDPATGDVIYARNDAEAFVPASNVKLYTAAAALDQLGPDYRYRTRVYIDGPVVNGTVMGNLIVRGSGDPTIGGYVQREDPTAVFEAWADALRAQGITHIRGDIVGDDDFLTGTPLGAGWSWDDVPFYYSAEVSGLVFNENTVDFVLEGRRPGMPASVRWMPFNTDYVDVINSTLTTPAGTGVDEDYYRRHGTNRIRLSSRVPAGATEEESLTVTNPTLFFVHVLREALLRNGIAVGGTAVDLDTTPIELDYSEDRYEQVAVYTSPPLRDIAATLLQESHNLYAEQLLRTLGAEQPVYDLEGEEDVEPGSAEMGLEAAKRTFIRAGIDPDAIELADGSGLSRYNLVTPTSTVKLLRFMRGHPEEAVRTAFLEALPVGGVSGTLEYRFGGEAAYDNVRAKTGTLSHVSALSGYVTAADGTPLVFSIMCNNHLADTWRVEAAQNRIVNALAASRL